MTGAVLAIKSHADSVRGHIGLIRAGALLRDEMELMLKPHGLTAWL